MLTRNHLLPERKSRAVIVESRRIIYAQRLSEERAASIKAYLAGHGTDASRLTIVGSGERKPVVANTKPDGSDDPAGRQKNRRVEIVINTCV